jgi:transcriptional regulator with XRE-family HTH domain
MDSNELKDIRDAISLRQKDLARILGVPYRTYQNWEQPPGSNAHRQIPDEMADRIKCLHDLKRESQGEGGFPEKLTWLQVPFRKEELEEFYLRADFLEKPPAQLIRQAVLKILQSSIADLED